MPKKKPFNNPFSGVKLPQSPPPPAPKAPPAPDPPPPRQQRELNEDELWTVAVDGTMPLSDRSRRVKPGPQPLSIAPAALDPDLEVYDELRALVTGEVPFDIADQIAGLEAFDA